MGPMTEARWEAMTYYIRVYRGRVEHIIDVALGASLDEDVWGEDGLTWCGIAFDAERSYYAMDTRDEQWRLCPRCARERSNRQVEQVVLGQ